MSLAHRVAAVVLPDAVKRRHERWATQRYLDAVRPATQEYVRRHGLTVRHGPFTGLRYVPVLHATWSEDLVAKLAGTYECELHPAIEEWIAARPRTIVDVGCAEGFYAVGLACAIPGATVHAHDVDTAAREQTAAMAAHNDVGQRVVVAGACTPAALGELPGDGVALLADCEGCERVLLDPEAAPVLRGWRMIVELHEFVDAAIATDLIERFQATHEARLVEQAPRDAAAPPELAFLSARTRARLLDERRPARMRWAVLRPRGRS